MWGSMLVRVGMRKVAMAVFMRVIVSRRIECAVAMPVISIRNMSMSLIPECGTMSGINLNAWELDRALVDVVVAQITANEYGVPKHPRTTLIQGFWRNGNSVRKHSKSGIVAAGGAVANVKVRDRSPRPRRPDRKRIASKVIVPSIYWTNQSNAC